MEQGVSEAVDVILEVIGATFVIGLISASAIGSHILPIIERMI